MKVVLKEKLVQFLEKKGIEALTVQLPKARGC